MPSTNSLLVLNFCALLVGASAGVGLWAAFQIVKRVSEETPRRLAAVPMLFKLFLPFARMSAPFFQKQQWEGLRGRTDTRLVQAGRDQEFSPEEFLGIRLVYAVFFSGLGLFFVAIAQQMVISKPVTGLGLFMIVFGAFYPAMWLNGQIRGRHRSMQRALPNVLDLMTLSVEAGRDFLTSLHEILQGRPKDPLGHELERVFREVQLGKQRRHSLRDMAARVQQPDVTQVMETLAQADELGVSIGQILRILGDQMRQKRFAQAEKLANESPVKLLLPLFLFIFPAVVIIMLGPVLLNSLKYFSH